MTTEQLIIQAIDNCIEFANAEQKRLYCWMKATLQYPDIERFVEEVKVATQGEGKVSAETIHKAIEYASSENEWLIRNLSVTDEKKDELAATEKIRLKEVEVRMVGVMQYLGMLKM